MLASREYEFVPTKPACVPSQKRRRIAPLIPPSPKFFSMMPGKLRRQSDLHVNEKSFTLVRHGIETSNICADRVWVLGSQSAAKLFRSTDLFGKIRCRFQSGASRLR